MRTNIRILSTLFILNLLIVCDCAADDCKPSPPPLQGKKIAVFIDHQYQRDEAYYTPLRLREAGAEVKIVSHYSPQVRRDKHTVETDITPQEAAKIPWDGIVIIGGFSPLEMREDETVIQIIKEVNARQGLVSAICHGVCALVTADIIDGKTVTGNEPRQIEFENAGASFIAKAPQVDGNIITAIGPANNGPYLDAMIHWFSGGEKQAKAKQQETYLAGRNIAIVIDNRYDYDQVNYPLVRLQHNGAKVVFVAKSKGQYVEYRGVGSPQNAMGIEEAFQKDFDAVILVGHWAADTYRRDDGVLDFVRSHLSKGTLVGSVNWGHTALISADMCQGYQIAVTPGMQNDIINAGGKAVLKPVQQDRNLVTCARDKDLPELMRTVVEYLEKKHQDTFED